MCHATVVRTNQTGFYGLLYGDFHMKFALPLPVVVVVVMEKRHGTMHWT